MPPIKYSCYPYITKEIIKFPIWAHQGNLCIPLPQLHDLLAEGFLYFAPEGKRQLFSPMTHRKEITISLWLW